MNPLPYPAGWCSTTLRHLDFTVRGAALLTKVLGCRVNICITEPILTILVYVDLDRLQTWFQNALSDVKPSWIGVMLLHHRLPNSKLSSLVNICGCDPATPIET